MNRLLLFLPFIILCTACSESETDPSAGENGWEKVVAMNQPTLSPQAIELADGRILVVGGVDPATSQFSSHGEIYDDQTKTWTSLTGGISGNIRLYALRNGDIIGIHANDGAGPLSVSRLKNGQLAFQSVGQIAIMMGSGFIPNYNDLLEMPDGTLVITAFNKIVLLKPSSSTLELYSDPALGVDYFRGASTLSRNESEFLVMCDLDESNGLDGVFRVWDLDEPYANIVEDFDNHGRYAYYMLQKYRINADTWLVCGGLNGLNVTLAASKARLINVATGEVTPADETINPASDPVFEEPVRIFPLEDGNLYIASQDGQKPTHRIYDPIAKRFLEGDGYLRYNKNGVPIVPKEINTNPAQAAAAVAITASEEIFVTSTSGQCWILRKK